MRLGYVNWLPPDLAAARAAGVARVHVDAWIAPSHTLASRVAEGSLAISPCAGCAEDLERLGLVARLVGADRLFAVSPAPVRVR
ncbi:hypothetical protein [Streptomyces sp. KL116D]|uniref:hypothetical protein n=1 Tax=Streptomyces sp. KL116D TaxID=3045152 RepID=UPI003559125A